MNYLIKVDEWECKFRVPGTFASISNWYLDVGCVSLRFASRPLIVHLQTCPTVLMNEIFSLVIKQSIVGGRHQVSNEAHSKHFSRLTRAYVFYSTHTHTDTLVSSKCYLFYLLCCSSSLSITLSLRTVQEWLLDRLGFFPHPSGKIYWLFPVHCNL